MNAEREALRHFRSRLRAAGSPERARVAKAYLKSGLRFYGASVPDVRAIAADFSRTHRDLTRTELRAIAEAAYATDVNEIRSAAIALLERRRDLLTPADLAWLIALVRRSDTWAHVDWLALGVIGEIVNARPRSRRRLSVWARDRNHWVRRTALLAQHDALKAERGDFALFARLAATMLDEREFFIRKAIGWVLREVSKKRPELAFAFLRDHRGRVSSLTLQEGAKYLPAERRLALGLPAQAAWIARERRRRALSEPFSQRGGSGR